ncbi:MAG: hypothetical protein JNK15_20140 [Planctomycetes bacterium]|nr:hypothetical protein [Planctomycetota bacterium]
MPNRSPARIPFFATVFAFALAPLAAQAIRVDQGSVLTAGSTATITYTDPSKAGQDVTVTVTGGFPVPFTTNLTITLDANGAGSTEWLVSSLWRIVRFNGPNAVEVTCAIR